MIFKWFSQYYLAVFGKKDTHRLMKSISRREYEIRREAIGDRF